MLVTTFTIHVTEPLVAFSIGPIAVHWYGLAYLVAFIAAWRYAIYLGKLPPRSLHKSIFDDLLFWMIIGVILGGRLGYVLFYNFSYYLSHPLEILYTWKGGMSFHGGLIGSLLALFLFAQKKKQPFWLLCDCVAPGVPIGLFFGRIANFFNGELYGRATESPIGVIFESGGPYPRHPSQLYEAFLEGIVLFFLLLWASNKENLRGRHGFISGLFGLGYGLSRFIVEFFREPDEQKGFLWGGLTMGQYLSLPMIIFGLLLLFYAKKIPSNLNDKMV